MKQLDVRSWIPLWFLLGCGIALIRFAGDRNSTLAAAYSRPLFAPPEAIKYVTFGYSEVMADSLWIRVIQDIEYCENVEDSDKAREAEAIDWDQLSPEEQHRRSLPPALSGDRSLHREKSRCDKGWVYNYIHAITELAPRFRMPYSAGATIMSVMVDDREGARLIYEKGIKQFPEDWTMSYRAAYHYLYEVDDPVRAAELLILAGDKGAPYWVKLLASRLYTASGRAELAKPILEETLATTPEGPAADRLRQRLREVEEVLRRAQSRPETSSSRAK
ncbi:MAG: hypothetical protein NDI61_10410 [Bdellovibrionaceae bacterium]|nr:hypothetical protein [Pseudobdellovibrionaceae bacterium]